MKITLNDQQSISDIRNSFNTLFPFLKIEFFSKRHQPGEASSLNFLVPKETTLKECRSTHYTEELYITPDMKVSELEELLWTKLGLGVQVFRKSGKLWLETILTDNWTLAEQNSEGEFLSKNVEPDEPEYYQDRD